MDAVIEESKQVDVFYSMNSGSGFGNWVQCDFKSLIITQEPFNELKLRYIFTETGTTKVNSYGILYGHDEIAGTLPLGFLETLNINTPANTQIQVPNGRWYHKDGKSLEIFYDGIRMLEGVDYTETNVGYSDKSNTVKFAFALENTKTVVFKEIYGNGNVSSSSSGSGVVPWSNGLDNYNANPFEKLMIDTRTNTVTINLPDTASVGDEIQFVDKFGTFSSNPLILHSSFPIMNINNDYILTENFTHATAIFLDTTIGWNIYYYYSFSH